MQWKCLNRTVPVETPKPTCAQNFNSSEKHSEQQRNGLCSSGCQTLLQLYFAVLWHSWNGLQSPEIDTPVNIFGGDA